MSNIKIQTSSDIEFSRNFTVDDFNAIVKNFDIISSLMSLQKLGALMSNQIAVNVNIEFEFYSSPKIKLKAGMLTRDFVSFVAKQILLNCKKKDIQYNDIDLFNLIYLYGNLEIDLHKIKTGGETKERGWLWVIRSTNYQWYYLRFHSSIIARYFWIFSKIFERNNKLGAKLDKALGIEIFKAMKIGTCICANFCPREDGKFATSFLMDSYTNTTIESLKPLLTEENILKFFDIFAITSKQFREEYKKYELTEATLKKYEFNPLKRFPVIKTNSEKKNEQYIIPSLSDFLYSSFEGLYYVLLDNLKAKEKDNLFKEIGIIFEMYIGEFIKQNNIDILSRAQIFSEITYKVGKKEWKSADWILISDEYIFQIECKKRKIDSYSKAGIQNTNGAGIDKLLGDIAKEVDKIAKKEEHLKSGKVGGISYKKQKIINIVVFLDEMFAINRYAREKIKAKMKEQSDNFYILGCWEFELVCQQSKNKQQNLYHSILDVVNGNTEIYHIDFLDKIYYNFFTNLKAED
ncbi:MAG: hypothetical protein KAR00_03430 [Candidatus Pacebacteria bacterium]|nr:hypothetical protein [Candidatus Paceibacterota bacterium]